MNFLEQFFTKTIKELVKEIKKEEGRRGSLTFIWPYSLCFQQLFTFGTRKEEEERPPASTFSSGGSICSLWYHFHHRRLCFFGMSLCFFNLIFHKLSLSIEASSIGEGGGYFFDGILFERIAGWSLVIYSEKDVEQIIYVNQNYYDWNSFHCSIQAKMLVQFNRLKKIVIFVRSEPSKIIPVYKKQLFEILFKWIVLFTKSYPKWDTLVFQLQ